MRLDRRTKILLLLRTLRDFEDAGRSLSDVRAPFESRAPLRGELWHEGSYATLERILESMRAPYPKIRRHTVGYYGSSVPARWSRKYLAEKGVDLISRRMPADVFVPQEVSENAGYLPSDAKIAARPRRVAA